MIFLGTAASEGYPNAFCACENCCIARAKGGPNLRKRSSVLLDGELLIDLGPDLMAASQIHAMPLSGIRYCLQTHEHEDHLNPHHLLSRSKYCGVGGDVPVLHLVASSNALRKIANAMRQMISFNGAPDSDQFAQINLSVQEVQPFETILLGPYRVTTIAANHAPETTALLYVIERDGRCLLYATDTGELNERSWQALVAGGFQFNVVVLDHTFGLQQRRPTGHMNQMMFIEHIERLRRCSLLAEDARIYAHHLAHHSNPSHDELSALAAPHGYLIAHDGLIVEV
jgi:phosphoribosyl 1,2-cyclic phosphate phosphodiesterase